MTVGWKGSPQTCVAPFNESVVRKSGLKYAFTYRVPHTSHTALLLETSLCACMAESITMSSSIAQKILVTSFLRQTSYVSKDKEVYQSREKEFFLLFLSFSGHIEDLRATKGVGGCRCRRVACNVIVCAPINRGFWFGTENFHP